jgi:antitoxin component YwqK of YwqJK toxin-antitoxin module
MSIAIESVPAVAAAAAAAAAEATAECYICYEPADVANPFLKPNACACKGSINLHLKCYFQIQSNKPSAECSACRTPYTYTPDSYVRVDETSADGIRSVGDRCIITGKYDGVRALYWPNGNHKCITEYNEGELQGIERGFNDDGGKHFEHFYMAGKREGESKYFRASDQTLEYTETYKDGVMYERDTYHPNGKRASSHGYDYGVPHGMYITFHEDGTKDALGEYQFGKKHGAEYCNYPSGRIRSVIDYEAGVRKTELNFYDKAGQDNKKSQISYDEKGLPHIEKYYNEEGFVIRIIVDGKPAEPFDRYIYTMGERVKLEA